MSEKLDRLAELLRHQTPERIDRLFNEVLDVGKKKRATPDSIKATMKTAVQERKLTAQNAKDLPEDMRQELHRRIAKMRAETDPSDLVEVLRWELLWRAIVKGETLAAICARAGLDPSAVSRFVGDERDVTLVTAAKLATALGLVLVPREGNEGKAS